MIARLRRLRGRLSRRVPGPDKWARIATGGSVRWR